MLAGYTGHELHFCVDEITTRRRGVAERLSMMEDGEGKGGWAVEWGVKAVETGGPCETTENASRRPAMPLE